MNWFKTALETIYRDHGVVAALLAAALLLLAAFAAGVNPFEWFN